ncbi:MAG: hypothetical protein HY921_04315 [Elusimicrobia bacterium]|nr:hypothetical protein [Elusimicrobiota bacterium]
MKRLKGALIAGAVLLGRPASSEINISPQSAAVLDRLQKITAAGSEKIYGNMFRLSSTGNFVIIDLDTWDVSRRASEQSSPFPVQGSDLAEFVFSKGGVRLVDLSEDLPEPVKLKRALEGDLSDEPGSGKELDPFGTTQSGEPKVRFKLTTGVKGKVETVKQKTASVTSIPTPDGEPDPKGVVRLAIIPIPGGSPSRIIIQSEEDAGGKRLTTVFICREKLMDVIVSDKSEKRDIPVREPCPTPRD